MSKSNAEVGRPIKIGLDYFPVKCLPNEKIDYLIALHGMAGYGIYTQTLIRIYSREGYWCSWTPKTVTLFAKDLGEKPETLNNVIQTCIEEGLFDKTLFETYQILSSSDIQKTYSHIVTKAKRNGCKIDTRYNIIEKTEQLTPEEIPINSGGNSNNPGSNLEEKPISTLFHPEETTQIKEKKRKGNNSKVKDINISFDIFWDLYDKKINREKTESKWNKLTDSERQKVIDYLPAYLNARPDKQFRKDPLTFLKNSGWEDELINATNNQLTKNGNNSTTFASTSKNGAGINYLQQLKREQEETAP